MASTCKCISTVKQNVIQRVAKDGSKAIAADLLNTAFLLGSLETKTVSKVEVTIEGKKKKLTVNIIHSYCPFCGRAYNSESKKSEEVSNG